MRDTLTLTDAEDLVEQYAQGVDEMEGYPGRRDYFRDLYRGWQQAYLPRVCELLDGEAPGRSLDVGPGWGTMLFWLASRGWHVSACDLMPIGGFVTHELLRDAPAAYHRHNIEHGPLPSSPHFDLILMTMVVGHLKWRPDQALRNVRAMLAPGGRAVVSVLNVEHFPGEYSHTDWRQVPTRDSGADPDPLMDVCCYTVEQFGDLLGSVFAGVEYIQTEPVIIAVCR